MILLWLVTRVEAATYSWVSPSKRLTATYLVDEAKNASTLEIVDTGATPPANLLESLGNAPALWALNSVTVGFWSDDEKTFSRIEVVKTDINFLQVYGEVWQFKPTAEGSKESYPHFDQTKQFQPNALNGEVGDRLAALDPKFPAIMFGLDGTLACRWKSLDVLELDNQQVINLPGANRPGVAFHATGQLAEDRQTLQFTCKELTGGNAQALKKNDQESHNGSAGHRGR